MTDKIDPYKFLREVVEPHMNHLAFRIGREKGDDGYRARVSNKGPRSHPSRPIADSRCITVYRDKYSLCNVAVFFESGSGVFVIGDLDTMGFERIRVEDATEENIKEEILKAIHY